MKSRVALILLSCGALVLSLLCLRGKNAVPAPRAGVAVSSPIENPAHDSIEAAAPPDGDDAVPVVAAPDEPRLGPKLEFSQGKLAWEEKIERVTLAEDLSDSAKARQLLAIIAVLPEHGMQTAAEEAVKRITDADYNSIALPVVTNPQTHGLVEGVLFEDLMDRPRAITLPALLRIARIPNHPYAKHALDNLDLLIGENFGGDWLKWEAAIQKAIAAEK